jgi:RNA polymerase sigma factor (TIGR02999 family)
MDADQGQDVTGLLVDWSHGNEAALQKLTPLVYDELRGLAERYLRRERADHTLQATALVHEAYVRMIDQHRVHWRNRLHFTAVAAQMMRRILVDHARRHSYAKRGGGARKRSLDDVGPPAAPDLTSEMLELNDALQALADVEPELSRIIELRFFGGMTSEEIAEFLGISVPTVTRRWRMARAWVYRFMTDA